MRQECNNIPCNIKYMYFNIAQKFTEITFFGDIKHKHFEKIIILLKEVVLGVNSLQKYFPC